VLRRLSVAVEWRDEPVDQPSGRPGDHSGPPAAGDHIWSATPFAPGKVILWTAKEPLVNGSPYANLPAHITTINQGC
jgi:hypothetical protein